MDTSDAGAVKTAGNSFLHTFERFGMDVGKSALAILSAAGPTVAGAAATSFGGPLAGTLATALVSSVISAEKMHVKAGEPKPVDGQTDHRKLAVLEDFTLFTPVIELAAQALGHPIANKAQFEASLPAAIDATVQGFNAYADLLSSLHVAPKAA